MLVKNVPSLLNDKYLYPDGEEFNKASYILFSDQSIAYHIKGKTDQYSSFYEALKNTNINKVQYSDEDIQKLAATFEISFDEAKQALDDSGNDLKAAIKNLRLKSL